MCKPCAHCANLYYFFTPSLPRANRVNQSKHFTKFANYSHRYCCGLVLVWTSLIWAERHPSQNSVDGYDVGHWTRLGLIQLLRPALARLSPLWRRAPAVQQVFIQFVNGLHKVDLSLQQVYLKDQTAKKGLHKV